MATGLLFPKWLWVRFSGKLGAMVPGERNPGFKKKDEGMTFYENEFKTQCLGSGNCRFHEYVRFRGGQRNQG
jgi:hypothetical protein